MADGACLNRRHETEIEIPMLTYKFNFLKTLQAAAILLKMHNGHMEFIRLLKLLYIADRELLGEIGRTLTGDEPAAMKKGPVLRMVQKLIKGTADAHLEEWNAVIRKDGHELLLQGDPGIGRLTKAEMKKLEEVSTRFWDTTSVDLSELTHSFKEWSEAFKDTDQPDSSFPIQWETALVDQGKEELIEAVCNAQKERQLAEAAFRG